MRRALSFLFSPPRRRITVLTNLQEFIREEGGGSILLLLATLTALILANSPLREHYEAIWATPLAVGVGNWALAMPLHEWINDGLMAIFFFVVGLEIKREFLVGELSSPRQAIFPAAAALGGMLVPAILYTVFNSGGPGEAGWAIPMATDIAFALGVLSLLGKRVPFALKIFLTAVAIVDDIGAVLVIALFYSHDLVVSNLVLGFVVLFILFGMNRLSVRKPLPYALLGIVLWVAFLHSGIHATIAGVLLAAAIPTNPKIDSQSFLKRTLGYLHMFEEAGEPGKDILTNSTQRSAVRELERAAESVTSPLQRLEHAFHPWVAYAILPIFALANAGVHLEGNLRDSFTNPVALGVLAGLVLGKQIGITSFAWIFTRLGFASKPRGLAWRQIYGAALLGGIGFTMSLFITSLAFVNVEFINVSKVAILTASVLSASGAFIVLVGFGKNKKRTE